MGPNPVIWCPYRMEMGYVYNTKQSRKTRTENPVNTVCSPTWGIFSAHTYSNNTKDKRKLRILCGYFLKKEITHPLTFIFLIF